MIIKFSKTFDKSYQKLPIKIQDTFNEKLVIFEKDKKSVVLNNHSLLGKYKGLYSINITGDYRAIFKENSNGKYEFIEFLKIGTHSQLYK